MAAAPLSTGLFNRARLCCELSSRVYCKLSVDWKPGQSVCSVPGSELQPDLLQLDDLSLLSSGTDLSASNAVEAAGAQLVFFLPGHDSELSSDPQLGAWWVPNMGYVVAFRGTAHPFDWLTNLQIHPSVINLPEGHKLSIHSGFYRGPSQIFEALVTALQEHLSALQQADAAAGRSVVPPRPDILFTGHSLGGAYTMGMLAHLAKLGLGSEGDKRFPFNVAGTITFGAPLVFLGKAGTSDLQMLFTDSCRIHHFVNGHDIIPRLLGQSLSGQLAGFLETTGRVGQIVAGILRGTHQFSPIGQYHLLSGSRVTSVDAATSPKVLAASMQSLLRHIGNAVQGKVTLGLDYINSHFLHNYTARLAACAASNVPGPCSGAPAAHVYVGPPGFQRPGRQVSPFAEEVNFAWVDKQQLPGLSVVSHSGMPKDLAAVLSQVEAYMGSEHAQKLGQKAIQKLGQKALKMLDPKAKQVASAAGVLTSGAAGTAGMMTASVALGAAGLVVGVVTLGICAVLLVQNKKMQKAIQQVSNKVDYVSGQVEHVSRQVEQVSHQVQHVSKQVEQVSSQVADLHNMTAQYCQHISSQIQDIGKALQEHSRLTLEHLQQIEQQQARTNLMLEGLQEALQGERFAHWQRLCRGMRDLTGLLQDAGLGRDRLEAPARDLATSAYDFQNQTIYQLQQCQKKADMEMEEMMPPLRPAHKLKAIDLWHGLHVQLAISTIADGLARRTLELNTEGGHGDAVELLLSQAGWAVQGASLFDLARPEARKALRQLKMVVTGLNILNATSGDPTRLQTAAGEQARLQAAAGQAAGGQQLTVTVSEEDISWDDGLQDLEPIVSKLAAAASGQHATAEARADPVVIQLDTLADLEWLCEFKGFGDPANVPLSSLPRHRLTCKALLKALGMDERSRNLQAVIDAASSLSPEELESIKLAILPDFKTYVMEYIQSAFRTQLHAPAVAQVLRIQEV